MNMQNVSNLVIPEGEVRTIHDEDSRLLWGRVSYDVKYSGDAAQDGTPTPDAPVTIQTATGVQTVKVCGKNLLKIPDGLFVTQGLTVTRLDNTITVSGKYTGSNNYKSLLNSNGTTVALERELPAGTYVVSMANSASKQLEVSLYNSSDVRVGRLLIPAGTRTTAFSLSETATGIKLFINYLVTNEDVNVNYANLQIEAGSTPTTYEPYQSQSYTIDLGTTELCKTGNYQDYIYKSGDDWYVHKETGKVLLDGSEASLAYLNGVIYYDGIDRIVSGTCYSNYYLYGGVAGNTTAAYANGNNRISFFSTGNRIFIRNDALSSKANWQTWLSSHNTSVYYAIATPTETKITDNTLIGQLNTVHQFLTRYGYNSTVSGNLPLIISKTNL